MYFSPLLISFFHFLFVYFRVFHIWVRSRGARKTTHPVFSSFCLTMYCSSGYYMSSLPVPPALACRNSFALLVVWLNSSRILCCMLNSHHARLLILCSILCKYSACGNGVLDPLIYRDYTDCLRHKTACESERDCNFKTSNFSSCRGKQAEIYLPKRVMEI